MRFLAADGDRAGRREHRRGAAFTWLGRVHRGRADRRGRGRRGPRPAARRASRRVRRRLLGRRPLRADASAATPVFDARAGAAAGRRPGRGAHAPAAARPAGRRSRPARRSTSSCATRSARRPTAVRVPARPSSSTSSRRAATTTRSWSAPSSSPPRRRRRRRRRHHRGGRERGLRPRRRSALPGRQDELVRRVAAANPRTVVVVNAGRAGAAAVGRRGPRRAARLVPRPGVSATRWPTSCSARPSPAAGCRRPGRAPRTACRRPARRRRAAPTTRGSSSGTAPTTATAASRCYPFGHGARLHDVGVPGRSRPGDGRRPRCASATPARAPGARSCRSTPRAGERDRAAGALAGRLRGRGGRSGRGGRRRGRAPGAGARALGRRRLVRRAGRVHARRGAFKPRSSRRHRARRGELGQPTRTLSTV